MRDLSEQELESPAARRFLIAEIQRLDHECDELKTLRQQREDVRVELATVKERLVRDRKLEIIAFVATTIGSVGIGAAPSYIVAPNLAAVGWIFAFGSAILVLSGVLIKVVK